MMNPFAAPLNRRRHYTTAPRTWVPGELVTAGMMNTIRDSLIEIEAGTAAIKGTAATPFIMAGTAEAHAYNCGYGGAILNGYGAIDTAKYISLTNLGGPSYFGIDSSNGGTFAKPNGTIIYSATPAGMRITIAAGGGFEINSNAGNNFKIHNNGGISLFDWVTPDSAGILRLGGSASVSIRMYAATDQHASSLNYYQGTSSVWAMHCWLTNQSHLYWQNLNGAANPMYLTQGGALYAAAFTLTSDARLKRDLGKYESIDALSKLVVRSFEWIKDGTSARGLFAQEAQHVIPHAVNEGSEDLLPTGEYVTAWGVDYSKIVPDLIVGWQNHEARLAALEGKVVGPAS
jgi:hypothetical protein